MSSISRYPDAATSARLQRLTTWPLWSLSANLLLIVGAEMLIAAARPLEGMGVYVVLLIGLALYRAFAQHDVEQKLTLALLLVPLTRILSLALPLLRFPHTVWYAIVAVPLLVAAWMVVRKAGLSRTALGLRSGNLVLQVMIALGGLGLGAAQYVILQPEPLVSSFSWTTLWLPILVLLVCTGFTEEFIFRGVLQSTALMAIGRWALVYVSLLFAALQIGQFSLVHVAFVFGVGLLFAWITYSSGSILGVSVAHGLSNIMLLIGMPYVQQYSASPVAAWVPWAIVGGAMLAMIAIAALIFTSVNREGQPQAVPASSMRTARISAGVAYVDLALRTGLPVRLLAEIEHGLRAPKPEQLRLIADGLGIQPNSLTYPGAMAYSA